MPIKKFKPNTSGTRHMTKLVNEEITKSTPEKSLLVKLNKSGGRNNQGKITVRHIGGGVRRKYRLIDFKRNKDNIKATVTAIEYDPNRSANIALLTYADGEKRYIIAPLNLKVGDKVESADNADIKTGNSVALMNIPEGTLIHNIELFPGRGGSMIRSAGSSAQLLGKEDKYVLVRLKSGETRKILGTCKATIGSVGNIDYELVSLGKAGRKRHMGIRPTVRGSVMNPNDHPHGGGEGKAPIGRKKPVTPWGKPALGYKTRKTKKSSEKLIVNHRKK